MNDAKFELRGFKADDLFPMFGILSKVGMEDLKNTMNPDTIRKMMSGMNSEDADSEAQMQMVGANIMMNVASIVMKNLPSCKSDIYNLLSNLSGMTVKEIADLPMGTFAEMIVAVIQKPDFKDFFKAVSKLFR